MDPQAIQILLVEDDPVVRKLNGQILKLEGYSMTVVQDGFSALEAMAEAVPDIVLIDVMMPGMDGTELCRKAREQFGSGFTVLFLTALDDTPTLRKCANAGGDDYLVKEGSPDSMLARVHYWAQVRNGEIAPADRRPSLHDVLNEMS